MLSVWLSCPVQLVCSSVCNVGVLLPNGWLDQMKLGVQVDLGPGHIVLDGDPAPPAPKGHSPQFSAHICCGQMGGWIKMPLGREVGLDPSDIVLDGTQLHSPKRGQGQSPQFSVHVCCDQTAGWIVMSLGMEISATQATLR